MTAVRAPIPSPSGILIIAKPNAGNSHMAVAAATITVSTQNPNANENVNQNWKISNCSMLKANKNEQKKFCPKGDQTFDF